MRFFLKKTFSDKFNFDEKLSWEGEKKSCFFYLYGIVLLKKETV